MSGSVHERPKLWSVRGMFWLLVFFLICLVPVVIFGGSAAYFYINGKEEWQDTRVCTVESAYERTDGGGSLMDGSSTYVMVESSDCGQIALSGGLERRSFEETAQYLDNHAGERFRFYVGKIQLSKNLLTARRVEIIE